MKIPPNVRLSQPAADALRKIDALQKFPVPATDVAVQRILTKLNITDLTIVTTILADNGIGGAR